MPAIGTEAGILTFGQLGTAIRAATERCRAIGLEPGALASLIVADPIWHVCLIAALYRRGVASLSATDADAPQLSVLRPAVLLHDRSPPAGFTGRTLRVDPDWFSASSSAAAAAP